MPSNLSAQSNESVALIQSAIQSAHQMEVSAIEEFVSKVECELKSLKSLVNQQTPYSPELIKLLYEISDDSRRIGGFLSLQRSPTEETDRWASARLADLTTKVIHSQELMQRRI